MKKNGSEERERRREEGGKSTDPIRDGGLYGSGDDREAKYAILKYVSLVCGLF